MNLSLNVYILFDCQNEEEYFHGLALLDTQFIFSVDFLVFYWIIDAWGITELHTFEANMQISLNLSLFLPLLNLTCLKSSGRRGMLWRKGAKLK